MEYTVSGQAEGIIFGATGMQGIIQNIRTIITTVQGTVPLDRGFGIETDDVDTPMAVAQARLTAKIISALHANEPRIEVVGVSYEIDEREGRTVPNVKFVLREGVTLE